MLLLQRGDTRWMYENKKIARSFIYAQFLRLFSIFSSSRRNNGYEEDIKGRELTLHAIWLLHFGLSWKESWLERVSREHVSQISSFTFCHAGSIIINPRKKFILLFFNPFFAHLKAICINLHVNKISFMLDEKKIR